MINIHIGALINRFSSSLVPSPHFSPGGEMITQRFGFTKDFTKKWNNLVYFRLSKILCGFKDQVRARPSGEKCGLECFDRVFRPAISLMGRATAI